MQAEECGDVVERPLSPIEQGLLFHYCYESQGAYVDQMVCDLIGPLDVQHLKQVLVRLLGLHESLRTGYIFRRGLEATCVIRKFVTPRIVEIDLSAIPDARAVLSRHVKADAESRFDLSRQVSRCTLYRLEERLHVFAWTYHHAVADSWTLRVLQEHFCAIYRALLEGRQDGLKATPYTAYIEWIASQDRKSTLSWWGAYLKRFTSRKGKDLTPTVTSDNRVCLHVTLPLLLLGMVNEVCRRCKVTRNIVLLAMWGILTLDHQKTSDCLVGCVVFGRNIAVRGIEQMAGVCANTVPIVIDGSKTVRELFAELQRHVLAASARSYLALSDILASAGLSRRDLHSIVNFTIDEGTVRNKHVGHLPFEITNLRYTQAANFDAYLDIEAHTTGIEITINFDRVRLHFDAGDIVRKCEQIVRCFANHPDSSAQDVLDVLLMGASPYDVEFAFELPSGKHEV